jgi:hypothetical protein
MTFRRDRTIERPRPNPRNNTVSALVKVIR